MRQSKWAPSIIPEGEDHNVYLVVDDFGYIGLCHGRRRLARLRSTGAAAGNRAGASLEY
jgi:hypothetical protein